MLIPRPRKALLFQLALIGCLAGLAVGCDEKTDPVSDGSAPDDDDVDVDGDAPDDIDPDDGDEEPAKPTPRPPGKDAGKDAGKDVPAKDAGKDAGAGPGKVDGGATDSGRPTKPTEPAKDGGGGPVAPSEGCTANLLDVPDDPIARGPWDTGVRTVKIGRLTVELFYPAEPGATGEEVTYNATQWLPAPEQKKVTAEHAHILAPLGGHLYRDVPIDAEHGPYPAVIFIHGTASHRAASLSTNTHWASRGFIVLAADYPGLGLGDQLASSPECLLPTTGSQDIPGDVNLQISALKSASGDLEFLGDRVDNTRLAISGHSQGGCVTATLSNLPNVKIVMPFSGSTPTAAAPGLESILYVSGMKDTVIGYDFPLIGNTVCPFLISSDTQGAYNGSPGPPATKKRMVGIAGGGHLTVTDLCEKNKLGKSSVEELQAAGVCGVGSAVIIGLPALFDCGTVDWKKGIEAVNYATTAALEETLYCKDRTAQFAALKTALPQVGDFREAVK
jgi:hypothetical protein